MTDKSFSEHISIQQALMAKAAQWLDERGYMVLINGAPDCEEIVNDQVMYGYAGGMMAAYAGAWCKARNLAAVVVNIHPDNVDRKKPISGRDVMNGRFSVYTRFMLTQRYLPIIAAIETLASRAEGKNKSIKAFNSRVESPLTVIRFSGHATVQGQGRDALNMLMRFLDMPEHRHLMRGGYYRFANGKYTLPEDLTEGTCRHTG